MTSKFLDYVGAGCFFLASSACGVEGLNHYLDARNLQKHERDYHTKSSQDSANEHEFRAVINGTLAIGFAGLGFNFLSRRKEDEKNSDGNVK